MPVATSSPVKRAAGEGEEKGEGPTNREASPAAKRQKLDVGGSASGSKQSNKPEGLKSKASSGLPKLDVAAAASHASETAAGKSGEGTPLFDTPTTPHPTREAA